MEEEQSYNKENTEDIFNFLGEDSQNRLPEGDENDEPKMNITCGSIWKWYIDPATGLEKSYPLTCGKFRECERCHDRRKEGFVKRIAHANMTGKRVGVIPLDSEAESVISAVTKDDYLRLPSEKGGALFYDILAYADTTEDNSMAAGTLVITDDKTLAELDGLFDWDDLTNTPEGSRPSGNLGKIDTTVQRKKSDEWAEVTIDTLEINSLFETRAKIAFEEAVADTAMLNPKTPDEVETAISQRIDAAINRMKEWRVSVRKRDSKKVWIKLSDIDWQKNSDMYVTIQNTIHGNKWSENRKKLIEEWKKPPE